MTVARWPLVNNKIRRGMTNHTFGMVRTRTDGTKKPHQGWDLYASTGTKCYAISDGYVVFSDISGDFGNTVIIEFSQDSKTLYATYCHLSKRLLEVKPNREDNKVAAEALVGLTGTSGNAKGMTGLDQHLHFEIRTVMLPGKGLQGRIDPKDVFGEVPLSAVKFSALTNPG